MNAGGLYREMYASQAEWYVGADEAGDAHE